MGALESLVLLPLVLLCCYGVGRWVFRPLRKAALERGRRTQFLLTDVYVLLLQLGLAGLGFFAFSDGTLAPGALVGMLIAWALLAWWWYLGVKWLSAAGVRSVPHRGVISFFAVPMAFGLPLVFLVLMLTPRGMSISSDDESARDFIYFFGMEIQTTEGLLTAMRAAAALLPLVILLGGTLGSRLLTRMALASRETPPDEADAEAGSPERPLSA